MERERAIHEVAVFQNRLDLLVSLHKESWSPWDWNAVRNTPPPQMPPATRLHESRAIETYNAYAPSFTDKLVGAEPAKRAQLAAAIDEARRLDAAEYQAATDRHRAEVQHWEWFQRIAHGVLAGDVGACQAVLQYLGPFGELQELGSSLNVAMDQPWCVEAWFAAQSADFVPTEQLSLTSTGKLSRKKMSKSRYWEVYQDHVCSAALRIAREVFALLPIPIVFVHAGTLAINRQTGAHEHVAVLSVAFDRETLSTLNFELIDPSDSIRNFEHVMKFKKTTGFAAIEPLDPSEFQVSEQ